MRSQLANSRHGEDAWAAASARRPQAAVSTAAVPFGGCVGACEGIGVDARDPCSERPRGGFTMMFLPASPAPGPPTQPGILAPHGQT